MENILKSIISEYPNIWEHPTRFKSLLSDLLPEDKLHRTLFAISADEHIPSELFNKTEIDRREFAVLKKRLINACGCSDELAHEIIILWIDGFGLHITDFERLHILDTSIDTMEISIRSYNILKHAGIDTIGDIINLSKKEFYSFRNIGGKTSKEIIRQLAYMHVPYEMFMHLCNNKHPDETTYLDISEADTNAIWEKLCANEAIINDIYGENCKLIHLWGDHNRHEFRTGGILYCLEQAREYANILYDDDEGFRIEDEKPITRFFRRFDQGILCVWDALKHLPDLYDKSVIPDVYTAYFTECIDDGNYPELWDSVKAIENKYRKYIFDDDVSTSIDWESELCYEQGKLIENITWTGNQPTCITEPTTINHTYCSMDYNQLKYYLFWRTSFKNGEILPSMPCCILYISELLAEFGAYKPEERLEQLESLYKAFDLKNTEVARWIREYACIHNLHISETTIRNPAIMSWNNSPDEYTIEIISGNYEHAFEIMCHKSKWNPEKTRFIELTQGLDKIKDTTILILPKLNRLFDESGLILSDFLVGKIRMVKKKAFPYMGSIWTKHVIRKFYTPADESPAWDLPSRQVLITDDEGKVVERMEADMQYSDPYLSEYILKYTEMLFRKRVGYDHINLPKKLTGALKVNFGNGNVYALSANTELQTIEKKYISLYGEIERVIQETCYEYFETNSRIMDSMTSIINQ